MTHATPGLGCSGARRGAQLVLAVVMAVVIAVGCAETGFECGREVPGKPGTIRRCDRANEVCVCLTNSCARRVSVGPVRSNTSDAGEARQQSCPSGWLYVKSPFARADVAGECVPQSHLDLSGDAGIKDFAKGELICPGSPITPPEPKPVPPALDAGPDPMDSGSNDSGPVFDADIVDSAIADTAPPPGDAASEGGAP
jgi:hypothetical protein